MIYKYLTNVNSVTQIGGDKMSRVCSICGKGHMSGNTISHSHRKAPHSWSANVQKVSFKSGNKVVSGYVCAKCLKANKVERV